MPKKTPMRMCVSCRQMRPKKELVRVVRTPESGVVIDQTGRMNGRGAYLCPSAACLERAIKTRALDRALDTSIEQSVVQKLREAFGACETTNE